MCYTSHTEDFVKEFYLKFGIFEPQQLQFRKVARKLGVNVFYWSKPSQALFLGDYGCIFLNDQLSDQQKWQDFNHELAHVLLHVGNQKKMSESFRRYQEEKANQFMYHACIPSFMLNQLKIHDYSQKSVIKVQQLFNVEYDFAFKRLEQYINKKLLFQNRMVCLT